MERTKAEEYQSIIDDTREWKNECRDNSFQVAKADHERLVVVLAELEKDKFANSKTIQTTRYKLADAKLNMESLSKVL